MIHLILRASYRSLTLHVVICKNTYVFIVSVHLYEWNRQLNDLINPAQIIFQDVAKCYCYVLYTYLFLAYIIIIYPDNQVSDYRFSSNSLCFYFCHIQCLNLLNLNLSLTSFKHQGSRCVCYDQRCTMFIWIISKI